jgi:hypothetical protein
MSIKALRKALAAPDRWFARATWTPADFDDAGYSAAPRAYIAAACNAAPKLLEERDVLLRVLEGWVWARQNGASEELAEQWAVQAITKAKEAA